jgi:cobalt-zinc-cadmium efflux system membrane fusion protein
LEVELPGEIALNADKVAHIVPRFPGIALEVRKNLGDRVGEGEVLAVVQSNESVAPYDLKSFVAGTIVEKHITLGEFVRDDADVFVVADLSTVWAKISVYAKYLSTIRPGARVRLTTSGVEEVAEGTIDYVGPIVGERTRTGIARAVLPNVRGLWQPGLFVTARVVIDEFVAPIAVPDDAIQTIRDEPVVFVKEGREFEIRPVRLGRSDGKMVEILEGLQLGEEYVAAESYIFKAEFGKSEAGHEH